MIIPFLTMSHLQEVPKRRLFILRLVIVTCILPLASLVVSTIGIRGTIQNVDRPGDDESPTGIALRLRVNIVTWLSSTAASLKIPGYTLFILLVLQAGCQPILTKFFIPDELIRTTAVLAQECCKFFFSVLILASYGDLKEPIKYWSFLSALTAAGVPSVLYVVQNYCNLMANQVLPPVTFVVLNQTKTLSTAWCCFILLGQKQSDTQVMALLLLVFSALVVQGRILWGTSAQDDSKSNESSLPDETQDDNQHESASSETESEELTALLEQTETSSERSESPAGAKSDERAEHLLIMGVLPALGASFLSGLGKLPAP